MIIELNETNFENEIKQGLKLVEFYATWCIYCKKQRIELQNFEDAPMWIGIVDGDESPNIIKKYKIEGYPTFILFNDGAKIAEFSGFHTKEQLLGRLGQIIKNK
jgi:thioredoxin 1